MENDSSFDSVNEYFKHLGKITREINEERMARLWKLAKKGDEQAKNKILEMNLRLVIPTAKRFLRPGMELMDLVEEGNLGLLQAIEKFEPKRGYQFSTYAVYWIEQYIRKYIEEQSGPIKIPSHAWGNLKRWFRVWNEFRDKNGREPSLSEMAKALRLTARQVKSVVDTLNAATAIDSLTTLVHEEEEMTLEDLISDDGKGNPHDVFSQKEDQKTIKQSMNDLNERDRQIIIMRYGLDDNEPKTLGEVADKLGLSRERVRQIEERAVSTLRREALRSGILERMEGDHRTRKIHSAMQPRTKTDILGKEKAQSILAKLLHRAQDSAKNMLAKAAKKRKQHASAKKVTARIKQKVAVKKKKIIKKISSLKKRVQSRGKKRVQPVHKKATKKVVKKVARKAVVKKRKPTGKKITPRKKIATQKKSRRK